VYKEDGLMETIFVAQRCLLLPGFDYPEKIAAQSEPRSLGEEEEGIELLILPKKEPLLVWVETERDEKVFSGEPVVRQKLDRRVGGEVAFVRRKVFRLPSQDASSPHTFRATGFATTALGCAHKNKVSVNI